MKTDKIILEIMELKTMLRTCLALLAQQSDLSKKQIDDLLAQSAEDYGQDMKTLLPNKPSSYQKSKR